MVLTSLVRKSRSVATRRKSGESMENEWQLQDAKARFSEVFRLAREQGPQRVSKHGKTAVVVIPAEEYERLRRTTKRKRSLTTFFARSPLAGCGLEIDRPTDPGRDIDL
jgi:antitoxin Phd